MEGGPKELSVSDLKAVIHLPSKIFTNTGAKTCVFYFVKKVEGCNVLDVKLKFSKTQQETGRNYTFSKEHNTTNVKFYNYDPVEDVKNLLVDVPIERIARNKYSLRYAEYMNEENRGVQHTGSSMFLREKFLSSGEFKKLKARLAGEFEKLKARLVAGGDQQGKDLYDDLSAPTVSTCSVFTVLAIAAHEGRNAAVVDIGGAFLNAEMTTGIDVHMRLDRTINDMMVELDPRYEGYRDTKG